MIEINTVLGVLFIFAFDFESKNISCFLKCVVIYMIFQEDMSLS